MRLCHCYLSINQAEVVVGLDEQMNEAGTRTVVTASKKEHQQH